MSDGREAFRAAVAVQVARWQLEQTATSWGSFHTGGRDLCQGTRSSAPAGLLVHDTAPVVADEGGIARRTQASIPA